MTVKDTPDLTSQPLALLGAVQAPAPSEPAPLATLSPPPLSTPFSACPELVQARILPRLEDSRDKEP